MKENYISWNCLYQVVAFACSIEFFPFKFAAQRATAHECDATMYYRKLVAGLITCFA